MEMKDDVTKRDPRILTFEEVEHVSGSGFAEDYARWWQQIMNASATSLATQIGRGQVN